MGFRGARIMLEHGFKRESTSLNIVPIKTYLNKLGNVYTEIFLIILVLNTVSHIWKELAKIPSL